MHQETQGPPFTHTGRNWKILTQVSFPNSIRRNSPVRLSESQAEIQKISGEILEHVCKHAFPTSTHFTLAYVIFFAIPLDGLKDTRTRTHTRTRTRTRTYIRTVTYSDPGPGSIVFQSAPSNSIITECDLCLPGVLEMLFADGRRLAAARCDGHE